MKRFLVILVSLFLFSGIVLGQGGEGPEVSNVTVEKVKEVKSSDDPIALSYFLEGVEKFNSKNYLDAIMFADFAKDRLGGTNESIQSLLIHSYVALHSLNKAGKEKEILILLQSDDSPLVNLKFVNDGGFEVLTVAKADKMIQGDWNYVSNMNANIILWGFFIAMIFIMICLFTDIPRYIKRKLFGTS